MEAGSEPDAPKRSQAQHPGGARLGVRRGQAFDGQHRGTSIHGHRRAALDWKRWCAPLDWHGGVTSIKRQRRRAALAVTILSREFLRQPILFRKRV